MVQRWIVAAVMMGVTAGTAAAQATVSPAPAAPLAQEVTVCKKCCSIFDFLGVGQIGKFAGALGRTQLGQAALAAASPFGRALGLGPSLLSKKFEESDNPAMQAANKAKKEEKAQAAKVQAIKYLGTLDCKCNPDVVPALLAALDDCSEVVRYEALKALRHRPCDSKGMGGLCKHKAHKYLKDCPQAAEPCEICGCQCERRVVERLDALLRERDENGCFKERSPRIRALAEQMISECLMMHQAPPLEEPAAGEEPIPEPTRPRQPVPEPALRRPTPEPSSGGQARYSPKWRTPGLQRTSFWRPQRQQSSRALAQQAFEKGNYAVAVAELTAAIQQDPANAELYSARSIAYSNLGMAQAAESDARTMLELQGRTK